MFPVEILGWGRKEAILAFFSYGGVYSAARFNYVF
jgi:hypothetical protein